MVGTLTVTGGKILDVAPECRAQAVSYTHLRQAVYSEMGHPLVLVRKANQVIVVILPFQSIRVQFIEVTAMLENS